MVISTSTGSSRVAPVLLSIFCGAGGLDLGFERAGFEVGLAFDKDPDSVASYNHNRPQAKLAHCEDIKDLSLDKLDEYWGGKFAPVGVIGGPPCQSFSGANPNSPEDDPRHLLPLVYAKLLKDLNDRSPVSFFALENVTGLTSSRHQKKLSGLLEKLAEAGFEVSHAILDARGFRVPQARKRLFIVGINRILFPGVIWEPPHSVIEKEEFLSVKTAIGGLPEPLHYCKEAARASIPHHRNHWCMRPKSKKFSQAGALTEGSSGNRSFKTLLWSKPSITVAYGNREVHIHPDCKRRLSVYEAMLLQSFPKDYELLGTLSSQITQVSNAVPPLLAEAVALSIGSQIKPGQPVVRKPLAAAHGKSRRPAQLPFTFSGAV